jgi:hypothetical protein
MRVVLLSAVLAVDFPSSTSDNIGIGASPSEKFE